MTTMTIADLPASRALDYQAMAAIRGAGGAPWIFGAFVPFQPASAQVQPIVNFYQTNYTATNLTLQTENINVQNSAPSANINVGAVQNALNINLVPASPHP